MSDDIWRRRDNTDSNDSSGYGTDFGSDFGTVQFADDPTAEPVLSFGDAETGNLPHWTEPATGELPFVTFAATHENKWKLQRRTPIYRKMNWTEPRKS